MLECQEYIDMLKKKGYTLRDDKFWIMPKGKTYPLYEELDIIRYLISNKATKGIKRIRGFSAMSTEKQRILAKQGGRAAHQLGKAHEWSKEEAKEMGRKGGLKTQENRLNHIGCKNCNGTKKVLNKLEIHNAAGTEIDLMYLPCIKYKK